MGQVEAVAERLPLSAVPLSVKLAVAAAKLELWHFVRVCLVDAGPVAGDDERVAASASELGVGPEGLGPATVFASWQAIAARDTSSEILTECETFSSVARPRR